MDGQGEAGIEFAKTMADAIASRRCDVIVLTSINNHMLNERLDEIGASAMLSKPVGPSALFNALSSISHGDKWAGSARGRSHGELASGQPQFKAHVLVAEDNPVNQEVTLGTLESMGCSVVTVVSGTEAVQMFEMQRFDIILMDCEMPIMDGLQATRRIRAIETRTWTVKNGAAVLPRIPIVAVTAHALDDVREKCLAAGMDAFLVKPFDEKRLADVLQAWLPVAEPAREPAIARTAATDTSTPGTEPADGGAIDERVIANLCQMHRDGHSSRLRRVVTQFDIVSVKLATSMRDNARDGDGEALWRAAHSLKSSAGALGATRLSTLCAEIETTSRAAGVAEAAPMVEAVDGEVDAARRGLHAILGEI